MDRVIRVLVGISFLHLASGIFPFWTDGIDPLSLESCNSSMFRCHNGICLRNSSRCNGEANCPDAEDEKNCDLFLCSPPMFFRCNNGQCITSTGRCNKSLDCSDGSDEQNCSGNDPSVQQDICGPSHAQCVSGGCILKSWFCDGYPDCPDKSDETPGCAAKKICEDNQFRCENGTCLPGNSRCDGVKDCNSGNDELHCEHQPLDLTNCTVANRKFACKDTYKCIDIRAACNGVDDCYDKSDELGTCNASNYRCMNCTHECKNTPNGPVCICSDGFVLSTDNNSCQDIDECEIYGICDQKCINTPGSYHCSCVRNYNLRTDGHTCIIKGGEEVLMYATKHKIKGISLKIPGPSFVVVDEVPLTAGIATDGDNVYWAVFENGSQAIVKLLQDGVTRHAIVTNGVVMPEGLALDWVTKNIYFSDQHFNYIAVCSNDGRSCAVLHSRSVHKPRAIALSPEHGLMFWTEWGRSPMIGRSGMDGSNSIPFVSSNIHWPNGVTVDVPGERIYWVDARSEIIETMNFDQTGRRVVVSEPTKHGFSVAVFENRLYWSDVQGMDILSCNKFTGKDRRVVTHEFNRIYGIHLKHPLLLTAEFADPCLKRECSDLCVLGPRRKGRSSQGPSRTCLCPDGKELSPDGVTCKQIRALPTVIVGARDQLHVVKHKTLGRDEIMSMTFSNMVISALTYNSNEGTVLIANSLNRNIYSFDVRKQRPPKPLVTYGLSLVTSMEYDELGNNLYWCDGDSFSIEAMSLETMARTLILGGSFTNIPSDLALAPEHGFMFVVIVYNSLYVRIDRFDMVGDTSSGTHLVEHDLAGPEIRLHYSREMQRLFWADPAGGDIESVKLDGSNRIKIVSGVSPYALTSTDGILFWFSIKSSNISWHDFHELYSSSDTKLDVNDEVSRSNMIVMTAISEPTNYSSPCQIDNGGCSHLCLVSSESDSKKVCACPIGYSLSIDNLSCAKPRRCSFPKFQCYTGECIPASHLCDTKHDCIHGEDEQFENCNIPRCPAHQFLCSDQQKCVDRKLRCDGQPDCADGSDEICDANCTVDSGQFWCDSGECIHIQFRCDGKVDCNHGQDESHCDNTTCAANDFTCKSGQCIPREWECDTETDCVDGSDEHAKCLRTHCEVDEFRCTNEKCVDHKLVCNGYNDCGDDSDERQCRTATGNDHSAYVYKICNPRIEFFCPSNERPCAPISVRCNGTEECKNGEDEQHCTTNPCRANKEFFCRVEKLCIPIEWTCDHKDDCSDGSDEHQKTCFAKPAKEQRCSGFRCADGECIPLSQVCDAVHHCADKSDEGEKCDVSCKTHGCSQKCFKLPSGPKCECVNGYHLDTDNKTCLDDNECDMDLCAQNCTNLAGKFECGCFSAEHRLRSDHVSCKATGPPLIYVSASEDKLTVVSNDLRHAAGVTFRTHLFNDIVEIDVDVHRNYIFVLFKNNILQRTLSGAERQEVQKILPHTIDFTVDWITDNVFYTDGSTIRFTNLNHSMDDIDVMLYNTSHDIWALVVDPIAGYLFWFETNPLLEGNNGKLMRLEGIGENVMSISKLEYGVRKLVIDSFARHLYWFDSNTESIRRMNYDGTSKKVVVYTEGHVVTFAFFENSVYWSSPGLIPIKKCRVYGRHPRKCELIKLSSHTVEHLVILQKNSQRLGPHPAGNFSSKMMCAIAPAGPKCICVDGLQGNHLCSTFVSSTRFKRKLNAVQTHASEHKDTGPGFSTVFAFFVIFILVASTGVIAYWHYYKPKSKILHRLHFHNAAYDVPESAFVGGMAKEPLLKPGEHAYENPFCQNPDDSSSSYLSAKNENSTRLKQLEEEPDSAYVLNSRKSFNEPLLKD